LAEFGVLNGKPITAPQWAEKMIKKTPCAEILSRENSEKMGFSARH
jgi:hypothetical protein